MAQRYRQVYSSMDIEYIILYHDILQYRDSGKQRVIEHVNS